MYQLAGNSALDSGLRVTSLDKRIFLLIRQMKGMMVTAD